LKRLDSGFRRNDEKWYFMTFYETIKINAKYTMSKVQSLMSDVR